MEYGSYLRAILALGFVLGLVGIASFLAKKFLLERQLMGGNKKKRLSIEEIHPIDTKRRLILIKRDNAEHLILLGQGADLLIESNINKASNHNNQPAKKAKK
jgi:flagellar protein FliO/FliZ